MVVGLVCKGQQRILPEDDARASVLKPECTVCGFQIWNGEIQPLRRLGAIGRMRLRGCTVQARRNWDLVSEPAPPQFLDVRNLCFFHSALLFHLWQILQRPSEFWYH